MQPESLELELKSQQLISQTVHQKLKTNSANVSGNVPVETDFLGGVLRGGKLAWFAIGSNIEIFSLKTGQRVAGQSFDERSVVTCVAEITSNELNTCLLMIAVQRSPIGGMLYLFSVQGSRIVDRIDVIDKITSCCFICDAACDRSNLKAFNGCAAVGTETGEVFLIDLNLNRCKEIISSQTPYNQHSDDSTCKILSAPISQDDVRIHVKKSRNEQINLGIRLDLSVIEPPSAITAILSMPQMQMIVVGFANGILALFNLSDLNALHLAYPPEIDSPLMKLTYIEPADDPRPCVYIWAFHGNESNFPFAVMHSVSFASKAYQDGENVYETFQWCRPDLTIPIYEKNSVPISCQSVTKIITEEEDELYSLCLLAWTNRMSSFVLVFDLNQWYKEQMPRVCDWRDYPSYLAPFPIQQFADSPLDIWLNPKSVVTFNSIQRPEEHFYPTSLSFDLIEVTSSTIYNLHWAGLQNNAIKKLSSTGAVAILVPDDCFTEFLEASLIPQLSDQNYHANPSKKMKQDFLLSMALEYNCMSLLRECAHHWADGSHMGRSSNDGLTLSTLTDWIWNQATLIKDRCNDLCRSLFDDSGITIDLRSRKILAHYSRQLKLLADLLNLIVVNYRQYIPDEIFDTLTAQRNSIRMTSEYQEVLQWLLNMGLLPEIVWNQTSLPEIKNDTITATPYPYRILNDFYTEQRQRFYDIDRSNIAPKTNSCKCLYIDSFIDRECNSYLLRNEWSNGLGDGLYPPPSLQAMLRILLIPGISLENKYMLFVYLFLDLHNFLEGEHFDVVQNLIKFPAVFKLNSSLIKTTQAFWNLDHNEYEIALRELISPLTSDRFITQWQQELLVNTLLIRDMPHLALQAVRAPGPSINTSLRIKTLLANNLITEAFELQRSKSDENLLIEFFKGCHEHKKWNHVLHLALTEREGEILCKFLQTCETLLSENLHLLYLLQRNKYIEAITYLDETKYKPRSMLMQRKLENTQDLIMSSYKLAMNSTDRTLCDQYMTIKNRLQVDVEQNSQTMPKPLSSELNPFIVDTNANVVGSVFHRAMISAKKTGFNTTANKNHIPLLGCIRIEIDPNDDGIEQKSIFETKPYVGMLKRRKESAYENPYTDPEAKQPAAKRQRVDSFSIADVEPKKHAPGINSYLLSSLTSQSHIFGKKMLSQLDDNDDDMDETVANDAEQGQRNSLGELCDTINLLSTPVVKSSRLEKHNRIDSRCHTPQSILKQRHTDIGSRRSTSPSLTVNSAKRSVDFNAKSFCYTIPSQNEEYRLDAIQETINLRENEDDDSSSVNTTNSIKGRRPIHSGKNSTASNSVDEFYSPETSKVENQSSVHEIEETDLSNITSQSNMPSPSTSYAVSPRRRLRSRTPEVAITSSTRITRSRSKLNLDDTVDSENVIAKQPILNTSTPKRATPRKSPSRFLSKEVITSNALKVQSEIEQTQKKLSESQESHDQQLYDNDLVDAAVDVKQRNMLKDASELSLRHRSMYAMDSADEGDETQPKRNLLQDSSAFASVYGVDTSESKVSSQIDASMDDDDDSQKTEIITGQMYDEEAELSGRERTINIEIEESSQTEANAEHLQLPHVDDDANMMEHVEAMGIPIEPSTSIGNQEPVVQVSKVETTVTEETRITVTEKLPTNYLIDSSAAVSDSVVQKFSHYEHYTSSFFSESQRPQENLLEDSSQCSTLILNESQSNETKDDEIVNIDSDSKSEQSENHSISSDSVESDNEIEEDIEEVEEEEEEEEAEEEENINVNDDEEVINISSSNSSDSEDDIESNKSEDDDDVGFIGKTASQQNYNIYDDLKYDLNDEFGISTTSQQQAGQFEHAGANDYNLTEMQAAPIELDIPSQEQAMNEMIYGDLNVADEDMLNLDVHNDAFGFEMHSDQEKMLGEHHGIHTNIVEIPNTVTQQLILVDALNTDTAQPSTSTETPQLAIGCTENVVVTEMTYTNVEISMADNENNDAINIEIQQKETVNETNILDQAMVVEETAMIVEQGDTHIVEMPNMESRQMAIDDAVNFEPAQQFSGSMELPNQESTTADDRTETAALNACETANTDVEFSCLANENIEIQKGETINETNVLDQAMIIEEDADTQKQLVELDTKQTEELSQPPVSDETKSTEAESRSTRAKSQQPPTIIATSSTASEDVKQSASTLRDFSIKLKRSDVTEKESMPSTSDSHPVDKSNRKKRAGSEQKELSVKPQKNESEQHQSDEQTVVGSQLKDEQNRKKRGNSKQKELPVVTEETAPIKETKQMEKEKVPKGSDKTKSTEVESRATRAKSQQPVTIEASSSTLEATKQGASVKKDFNIKLKKSDVEQLKATEKESAPSTSDSHPVDKSNRKKRAGSEQKEHSAKPQKTESEQTVPEQQADEANRKKRGSSQQKVLPTKTDDESTTSKATTSRRQRTTSNADSELGEKFDAEESVRSRHLRKAVSHQSLSEISENVEKESTPKKPRTPRKTAPRRAVSQQSLSSTSDSDSRASNEAALRVTRSKSIQSIQSMESDATSTSRTKRATSKQRSEDIDSQQEAKTLKRKKANSESSESELGDKFDADESSRSRRLRRAVSHQTLSKIEENVDEVSTPKKTRTPRKTAPRRAESYQSLSSTSHSEDKPAEEQPASRVTRSKSIQSIQSDESNATSTSRTKRAISKQRPDDVDTQQETKTSKRKKDNSESSARSAAALPSIPEDENQANSSLPAEYLETSRLTRSQRATIEKYSKTKAKVADAETVAKRNTRKTKADSESTKASTSDHSDTESVVSQKSTASKASKRSKTSEVSSSQRSTRQRAREQKK